MWTLPRYASAACVALLVEPPSAFVSALPRGVAPTDEAKYAAPFRCFDGSGSSLPESAINDDFCDCADGSDEPGTGACAGQESTLFFCVNEGSTSRQLYTSRVGDGVCDCCDGSDEASLAELRGQAASCNNVCEEQGKLEAERREKRAEVVRKGVELKEAASSDAVQDRAKIREEKAQLEKDLSSLEATYAEAKARAKALREAEEREKKAAAEEAAPAAASDPATPEEASKPKTDDVSEAPQATGATQEDKPQVSEYAKWMDGAEATLTEEKPAEASGDDPQVSEYAKWMDGAESMTGGAKDEAAKEDAHQEDEDAEEEEAAINDYGDEDDIGSGASSRPSANLTEEERLKEEVRQAKDRIKALNKKLTDLGEEHLGYASLAGKTLSRQVQEWKFKVVFFDKAEQDFTSLGRWSGFTGPHTAEFTGGASCWQGPQRKLTVTFECGVEEALLDVTEPSRCVYAATVVHPGACDPTELHTLSMGNRVIGPKDEL